MYAAIVAEGMQESLDGCVVFALALLYECPFLIAAVEGYLAVQLSCQPEYMVEPAHEPSFFLSHGWHGHMDATQGVEGPCDMHYDYLPWNGRQHFRCHAAEAVGCLAVAEVIAHDNLGGLEVFHKVREPCDKIYAGAYHLLQVHSGRGGYGSGIVHQQPSLLQLAFIAHGIHHQPHSHQGRRAAVGAHEDGGVHQAGHRLRP